MKVDLSKISSIEYLCDDINKIIYELYKEGPPSLKYIYVTGEYLRNVWDNVNNETDITLICDRFPDYLEPDFENTKYKRYSTSRETYYKHVKVFNFEITNPEDFLSSVPLSSSQIILDLKANDLYYTEDFINTMETRLVTLSGKENINLESEELCKLAERYKPFYLDPIFWQLVPTLSEKIAPYPKNLKELLNNDKQKYREQLG